MKPQPHLALVAGFALMAVAGATWAGPVQPFADGQAPVQQAVRYDDLDLTKNAGAERLAFRIRVAAEIACNGAVADIHPGSGPKGCAKVAIERAAAALNSPKVDAYLGLAPKADDYASNR